MPFRHFYRAWQKSRCRPTARATQSGCWRAFSPGAGGHQCVKWCACNIFRRKQSYLGNWCPNLNHTAKVDHALSQPGIGWNLWGCCRIAIVIRYGADSLRRACRCKRRHADARSPFSQECCVPTRWAFPQSQRTEYRDQGRE
jgi:hypothetical protein